MNIDGRKIRVTNEIVTASNIVSLSRLLAAVPIITLTQMNGGVPTIWVTTLIAYAILSDYLDGMLARRTGHVSELGKVLDPVADKLLALALFVYVWWLDRVPDWFMIAAIIRDLLILAGSSAIRRRTGKVAMAVLSGKISVNILAVYWIALFYFPDVSRIHQPLLTFCVIVMAYSLGEYMRRTIHILNGAEFN